MIDRDHVRGIEERRVGGRSGLCMYVSTRTYKHSICVLRTRSGRSPMLKPLSAWMAAAAWVVGF